MHIRLAKYMDAEEIAGNNVLLAYETEDMNVLFKKTLAGVKNVLSDQKKGFFIVAEEDNKIIGQMMITFEWSDWQNKNIWWMQSIYVQEKWRDKGIFKLLFNEIKNMATKQDIDSFRLYVHNKNILAQEIYKHIEFKKKPYTFYQLSL